MYVTTAYLYQQIQTILLVDITGIGSVFERRWRPVYAKNLKLNLGVDNVILFQFQNQDQKPVNISGSTFTFRIISQNGETLLYAREMISLSDALGRVKVVIPSADTLVLQAQPASWSIEVSSGDLSQAVYTDDYAGARGVIDIVDSVFPAFVDSALLTIPDQAPDSSVYYSSTIDTDGRGMTSLQLDAQAFTGSVRVEGSTDADAENVDWYDINFLDLDTGATVDSLHFVGSTERRGINVQGFHPYLRLSIDIENGSIDPIYYR